MERKCVLCILLENLWLEVSFIRKPKKERKNTFRGFKKRFFAFLLAMFNIAAFPYFKLIHVI